VERKKERKKRRDLENRMGGYSVLSIGEKYNIGKRVGV
jgi:hypothetical protein